MNTSLESRNKCNNELKFYYFDLLKLMVQIARIDPFMGSGATGKASIKLMRNFIGIENDANYFKIAEESIKKYQQ